MKFVGPFRLSCLLWYTIRCRRCRIVTVLPIISIWLARKKILIRYWTKLARASWIFSVEVLLCQMMKSWPSNKPRPCSRPRASKSARWSQTKNSRPWRSAGSGECSKRGLWSFLRCICNIAITSIIVQPSNQSAICHRIVAAYDMHSSAQSSDNYHHHKSHQSTRLIYKRQCFYLAVVICIQMI